MKYTPLESSIPKTLGVEAPSFEGSAVSFFTTTSFLYTLFFSAIIAAAFYRYSMAGISRMQASEEGIRRSNEILKRTTYGLLGVFSLFLILSTVNKDLLLGDIGLGALSAGSAGTFSGSVKTSTLSTSGGSGTSKACDSIDAVKASISSSGGVCGNVNCTLSSSCLTNNPYISIIKSQAAAAGVDYRMVVVTMCKESGANPNAKNLNKSNNSYDCGLMQINQTTPCSDSILDPTTNIKEGVSRMKQKINSTRQDFPGFPNVNGVPVAGVFASYNCCANGTVPNDPSSDCTIANGWSQTIPKWACPINPGTGDYNMCGVKAYACELSVCLKNVPN